MLPERVIGTQKFLRLWFSWQARGGLFYFTYFCSWSHL